MKIWATDDQSISQSVSQLTYSKRIYITPYVLNEWPFYSNKSKSIQTSKRCRRRVPTWYAVVRLVQASKVN